MNSEHDELCRKNFRNGECCGGGGLEYGIGLCHNCPDQQECICWFIDKVRDNERDKAVQRVEALFRGNYYGLTAIEREAAVIAAIKGDSDE